MTPDELRELIEKVVTVEDAIAVNRVLVTAPLLLGLWEAAETLHHFEMEEAEGYDPGPELVEQGYSSLVPHKTYNRRDELGDGLGKALTALEEAA